MAKRKILNLALKIQLTREYLDNGGLRQIYDLDLLHDLQQVKSDAFGNTDPNTVSARVNAFMMGILQMHNKEPFFDPDNISEYASLFQKERFFEQQKVDTLEQLEAVMNDFKETEDFLFRGQRESKWRLYNKAQRHWIIDGLFKTDLTYTVFLQQLVSAGRESYLPKIRETLQQFHIDTANDIAVLGFLQHHGCPTPLMDWTFSFFTGLFFAIDGWAPAQNNLEIDQYVSLYYLEKKYFENGSMRELLSGSLDTVSHEILDNLIKHLAEDEEQLKEMQEKFGDRSFFDRARIPGTGFIENMTSIENMAGIPLIYFSDDDQKSGLIFSLSNNKNVIRQRGVFIWNADPVVPAEVLAAEQYAKGKTADEPADFRFCKCLNIHKSLIPAIIEKLAGLGITSETIYPTTVDDIDTWHIYEEIK